MSSNRLMVVNKLTRYFDDGAIRIEVLRDVSFDFDQGEILALTGSSGVGKSTLLHILGGLDPPTSGQVLFKGTDLQQMSPRDLECYRNNEIGFVFQSHHLLPEFSALENVAMPLMIARESRGLALAKARNILEQVELGSRISHKPNELSGGEQQRVALARALVADPSLVLADEPTGNLDEETSQVVFDLMCRLNQDLNVTFFVATHNMKLARSMHRQLRLTDGKVESMEIGVSIGV